MASLKEFSDCSSHSAGGMLASRYLGDGSKENRTVLGRPGGLCFGEMSHAIIRAFSGCIPYVKFIPLFSFISPLTYYVQI